MAALLRPVFKSRFLLPGVLSAPRCLGFLGADDSQTAGLGRINTDASHGYYDKAYLFTDVAVVGGGRAGLSAAIAAAENSERVLLIDDGVRLGGSLQYRRDADEISPLIARLAALPAVTILDNARCEGLFSDGWLAIVKGTRLYKARAKRVVLATGAIGLPAVFRCNDLPGIALGTAAQRLIRMYGVRPATAPSYSPPMTPGMASPSIWPTQASRSRPWLTCVLHRTRRIFARPEYPRHQWQRDFRRGWKAARDRRRYRGDGLARRPRAHRV